MSIGRSSENTEPRSLGITVETALDLLRTGELSIRGLLAGSSNYTFLADITGDRLEALAVYKPRQGESPLWDFPHGTLCQREMAAFEVSEALGWGLVPPTVLRVGPYGKGAAQFFVDADFSQHYFTFNEEPEQRFALQQVAAFDLIINNADRKAGHTLLDHRGRLWAIDHGVCFHVQPKLRTVIWDFAELPVPGEILLDVAGLRAQLDADCPLQESLGRLLSEAEMEALVGRVDRLLAGGVFPAPDPYRRCYPWPLV